MRRRTTPRTIPLGAGICLEQPRAVVREATGRPRRTRASPSAVSNRAAGGNGDPMTVESGASTVHLTVPAKPEYVVLTRLALSAVCRLTPLQPEDVADLKLAITEAATALVQDGSGEQL